MAQLEWRIDDAAALSLARVITYYASIQLPKYNRNVDPDQRTSTQHELRKETPAVWQRWITGMGVEATPRHVRWMIG
ncbi:Protein of unknown function [Pyronema omphalodes CBS 100304]|uniref:Uncharacterized protein n=1 Tax=Pyronema omphalodes (strain CBS 100304) TaxID=1076935 RepID=U4L3C6_PYROM|nr:Protein of unknown function [Pyronema omphalodes CBS 100304]